MLRNKYKILGLVSCYNRVNTTIAFLESFFGLLKDSQVDLTLYLLDDGSSDNTSGIISKLYPSVNLINSLGGNYWAGGMRIVFQNINKKDIEDYTHLFVLNDDIVLKQNALIDSLIELEKTKWSDSSLPYAAVMSMIDLELGKVVYGGLNNKSRFGGFIFEVVKSKKSIIYADTLNMNAVLISRGAINKIGFLDKIFAHHRADIDFGLRLTKNGGLILVLPGVHGYCTLNSYRSFNYFSERNIFRRIKLLLHPKNEPFFERFIFFWRHSKNLGIFFYFTPYFTILFPRIRNSIVNSRILKKK